MNTGSQPCRAEQRCGKGGETFFLQIRLGGLICYRGDKQGRLNSRIMIHFVLPKPLSQSVERSSTSNVGFLNEFSMTGARESSGVVWRGTAREQGKEGIVQHRQEFTFRTHAFQPCGCAVLGSAGVLVEILQDRVAEFRVKKQEGHEDGTSGGSDMKKPE